MHGPRPDGACRCRSPRTGAMHRLQTRFPTITTTMPRMNCMDQPTLALLDRFRALQAGTPGLRARDAARQLGVSECELVFANPAARRLADDDWSTLSVRRQSGPGHGTGPQQGLRARTHRRLPPRPDRGQGRTRHQPGGRPALFLFHWRYAFALEESLRAAPGARYSSSTATDRPSRRCTSPPTATWRHLKPCANASPSSRAAAFDTRPAPEPRSNPTAPSTPPPSRLTGWPSRTCTNSIRCSSSTG